MRIVDIREIAIPLRSQIRNSGFDFSEMTTSVVAVITDVTRAGKPVTGFSFNSTGRYACGAAMRDRFIPRIKCAPPQSLLNDAGTNFAPEKMGIKLSWSGDTLSLKVNSSYSQSVIQFGGPPGTLVGSVNGIIRLKKH